MVTSCCVHGCRERQKKGNGISFHRFPVDKSMKEKWLIAMKRNNFVPSAASRLCSKHFKKDDFTDRGKLNKNAIPSILISPNGLISKSKKSPRKIVTQNLENSTAVLPVTSAEENKKSSTSKASTSVVLPSNPKYSLENKETLRNITEQRSLFCGSIPSTSTSSIIACSLENKETLRPRRRESYLGDFEEDDLNYPERAKRMWRVAKQMVKKQQETIKYLRNKSYRFLKKIKSLNAISHSPSNRISENCDSVLQPRWTISQNVGLIAQLKKYPVLYDLNHAEHTNQELKNECLGSILSALNHIRPGVTAAEVVTQWHILVKQYIQKPQNQEGASSSSGEDRQAWYFQKLKFLENLNLSDIKLEEYTTEKIDEIEFSDSELTTENSTMDPLGSFMKIEVEDSCLTDTRTNNDAVKMNGNEMNSKDENDIFGEFVAAQLKKITDELVRQDTILEIHNILHKALRKV